MCLCFVTDGTKHTETQTHVNAEVGRIFAEVFRELFLILITLAQNNAVVAKQPSGDEGISLNKHLNLLLGKIGQ